MEASFSTEGTSQLGDIAIVSSLAHSLRRKCEKKGERYSNHRGRSRPFLQPLRALCPESMPSISNNLRRGGHTTMLNALNQSDHPYYPSLMVIAKKEEIIEKLL